MLYYRLFYSSLAPQPSTKFIDKMCVFATFFINYSDFWKHFEDTQENDTIFERKFYDPFIKILQDKGKKKKTTKKQTGKTGKLSAELYFFAWIFSFLIVFLNCKIAVTFFFLCEKSNFWTLLWIWKSASFPVNDSLK